jgi:hypothetical protein
MGNMPIIIKAKLHPFDIPNVIPEKLMLSAKIMTPIFSPTAF